MFWVGFSQEYDWTNLVVIEGNPEAAQGGVTSKTYFNVLKEHLSTMLGSGYFMQDNAPIYTGCIVKAWFKHERIQVLDWPPYSPDLNPMKNLWGPLKHDIYKQDQSLFKAKSIRDDVQKRLMAAFIQIWDAIDEQHFITLASNVSRCCQVVIDVERWYIGY